MIKYDITLGYSLAPGWMAPFVDGLKTGQAMAMQCTSCQRVTFPPVRTCSCGEYAQSWIELSGVAELIYLCDGLDGQFALVRFAGADTMSVVKLEGFDSDVNKDAKNLGQLQPVSTELPAMIVRPAS